MARKHSASPSKSVTQSWRSRAASQERALASLELLDQSSEEKTRLSVALNSPQLLRFYARRFESINLRPNLATSSIEFLPHGGAHRPETGLVHHILERDTVVLSAHNRKCGRDERTS